MSNLPKNPKPHIGEKITGVLPKISSSERKKAIQEMTELISESNKIVAKYRSRHNETLHK
jgi:hypothetical protein